MLKYLERIKRWIHEHVLIREDISVREKIRQVLTIAELALGNKAPDFYYEDSLRAKAEKLEDKMYKRWALIMQQLEEESGYQIDDEFQALFVLALIANKKLDEYKEENSVLPSDPFNMFRNEESSTESIVS